MSITAREAIKQVYSTIESLDKAYYQHIAHDLCASVFNIDRETLLENIDSLLTDEQNASVKKMIVRCLSGEPIEYIIGKLVFGDCVIHVTPSVLIPRVETEILVEKGLMVLEQYKSPTIIDLATGSGCIALAIKKKRNDAKIFASDASQEALKIARHNGCLNKLDINWLEGDLFGAFDPIKADAIFCNPPYLSDQEYEQLNFNVKDFEPKRALLASNNGLFFYERLAQESCNFLKDQGWLFLEIGKDQASPVTQLLKTRFSKIRCLKDWSGHDRFIFAQKKY